MKITVEELIEMGARFATEHQGYLLNLPSVAIVFEDKPEGSKQMYRWTITFYERHGGRDVLHQKGMGDTFLDLLEMVLAFGDKFGRHKLRNEFRRLLADPEGR